MGLGFETHGALGKEFMKTTGQLAKAICFNPMSNSAYKRYGVIPVTASSQAAYTSSASKLSLRSSVEMPTSSTALLPTATPASSNECAQKVKNSSSKTSRSKALK